MIFNELVLVFFTHALQRIEFTLEIAFKGFTCLYNLVHDFKSLFLGDAGAEWVVCHVSSNSNSGWVDHSFLFGREVSILESFSGHVRYVLVVWRVTVVVLDHLVEELVEFVVGIVGTGIDADAGVLVGNTWENTEFEVNAFLAWLVFVLVPDFLSKAYFALWRRSSVEEVVKVNEILWSFVSSVEFEFWFFFHWLFALQVFIHFSITAVLVINASNLWLYILIEIATALFWAVEFSCWLCGSVALHGSKFHVFIVVIFNRHVPLWFFLLCKLI